MITTVSLQQIQHFPQDIQLKVLMWAQRFLKRELGQLSLHKLRFIEQGNLDAWQYEHGQLQSSLTETEEAIERICPLPQLADLL
ncbi:hypothetical protein GCM10027346_21010 [Hymenobacter seoulensis]